MAAERLVTGPVHREDGQAKTFVKICFIYTLHGLGMSQGRFVYYIILYQEGNHTPSTKPVLPEQVAFPSGNEISMV